MKSLYGGGAVTAAALIVSTLFVYARPSIAETSSYQQPANRQQPKIEETAPEVALNAEPASTERIVVGKVAEVVEKPTATIPASTAVARAIQTYVATAYSLRGRTASGALVAKGLIAADPSILPLGSRVRLDAGSYSGEYLVADTGGAVRGRHIDIWTSSSREAMRFGRRSVKLTVLSLGAPRRFRQRKARR